MFIRDKLFLSLGSLCAILVGVGGFALYSLRALENQNDIYNQLVEADSRFYQARLAQADYLLTETPGFKRDTLNYLQEIRVSLQQIKEKMLVEQSLQKIAKIQTNIATYQDHFEHLIAEKKNEISSKTALTNTGRIAEESIHQWSTGLAKPPGGFSNNDQAKLAGFDEYQQSKAVSDAFNGLRMTVWQYNERSTDDYETVLDARLQDLKQRIRSIEPAALSGDKEPLFQALQADLASYFEYLDAIRVARKSVVKAQRSLLVAANTASESTAQLMALEAEVATNVAAHTRRLVITAIVVALILGLALASWLINSILPPLRKSNNIALKLEQGDLVVADNITGNDEFTSLNRALSKATGTLKATIAQIKAATSSLSQLNNQVVVSVNASNQSIQAQKVEIDEFVAALQQLARASEQIAINANAASSASVNAVQQAQQGDLIIKKAQSAISSLSRGMDDASNVVDKLNNDSKNIASILQVIQSIAEQTNLLALNAAIEAARAGEHGRGFAVVADEVRNLAKRTQDSTSEITQIVEMIQLGAANVVEVMENSNQQSDQVVQLTTQASEAYAGIADSVNQVLEINTEVASGAKQQTEVSEIVNNNVIKIKTLVDENTQALMVIQQQVERQNQETKQLNVKVEYFNL